MKKILGLCFSLVFIFTGCKDGKTVNYEYSEGDIRLTITRDYIIIDSCTWFDGWGGAHWDDHKTIPRSDTIACQKLLDRLVK